MNAGLLSITLLVAMVEGGAPAAGELPRVAAVRIGWGCIEVPASYRVVETPTEIIDQHYGFITVPDRPRVEWSFGMSESHPLCHQTCKILSQREETLGGSTWSLGVLK